MHTCRLHFKISLYTQKLIEFYQPLRLHILEVFLEDKNSFHKVPADL